MKLNKILITASAISILALACVQSVKAQAARETRNFFMVDYAGISIRIDATSETLPGENATASVWINCTAIGVNMEYFNLSCYGFKTSGPEKASLYAVCLMNNVSLFLNQTSEYNYTIVIPSDVYGPTYSELFLKYTVFDEPIQRNPGFAMTSIRNIYFENLKEDFQRLNESYGQLNSTYGQLNDAFAQLNQTYWELYQNHTALQGNAGDLNSARQLTAVLGITTIFFVATTLYLILRKPKDYW